MSDIRYKIDNIKSKVKTKILPYALVGLGTVSSFSAVSILADKFHKKPKITELYSTTAASRPDFVVIDYQTDTLSNSETTVSAYFMNEYNSITQNYIEDAKEKNQYNLSETVLVHEQKHRENAKKGLKSFSMSPEQYYKVCMHDEISANMAQLLALRQKYIETGNIKVFEEDPRFSFYSDAILAGKINPNSDDKTDFDRDMSLIVNSTKIMWMKNFSHGYDKDHAQMTKYFVEAVGIDNINPDDENYKKSLEICYNIGGINFLDYMNNDIRVDNQSVKDATTIVNKPGVVTEEIVKLIEVNKDYNSIFYNNELKEYDGSMSIEQYYNLLQNQVLESKIRRDKEYRNAWLKNDDDGMEAEIARIKKEIIHGKKYRFLRKQIDEHFKKNLKLAEVTDVDIQNANYQNEVKSIYSLSFIPNCDDNSLFENSKVRVAEIQKELNDESKFLGKIKKMVLSTVLNKANKNKLSQPLKNYAGNPRYYAWSVDKRVSNVQHTEILDLTREVLKKPDEKKTKNNVYSEKTFNLGSAEVLFTHYNDGISKISIKNKNGKPKIIDNLKVIDLTNLDKGILAVTYSGEAIKIGKDGHLEELVASDTPASDCYWNNGVIMMEKRANKQTLWALQQKRDGTYDQKLLGIEVYDKAEDGKIVIYNAEGKVTSYTPEQLNKPFKPVKTMKKGGRS